MVQFVSCFQLPLVRKTGDTKKEKFNSISYNLKKKFQLKIPLNYTNNIKTKIIKIFVACRISLGKYMESSFKIEH